MLLSDVCVYTVCIRSAWFHIESCLPHKQLSTVALDQMWFDVIFQYENIARFLGVLSLVAMILTLATTNDSAAIVLHTIASNGRFSRHAIEKQFWSMLVGVVALVMLLVGKSQVTHREAAAAR